MLQSQEATLREKEHAEVQAVLLSMARSPLMGRLFSYLCQKYFEGLGSQLNEIRIAREVFGRTESFDRSQDAIARVEAHRLRKKLKLYYETEGRHHSVYIELPAGTYAPVFHHKDETTEVLDTATDSKAQSGLESESNIPVPAPPEPEAASLSSELVKSITGVRSAQTSSTRVKPSEQAPGTKHCVPLGDLRGHRLSCGASSIRGVAIANKDWSTTKRRCRIDLESGGDAGTRGGRFRAGSHAVRLRWAATHQPSR